jgi:hypothetical protein
VYSANFLKLAGIAEDVARDRAERITREFVEALQARNPAGLASMSDPDMLRTLYAAQEGYVCSGEDDLESALIDLLVDRAGQADRQLKTLVLNQAVATLPKLTKPQRRALALSYAVRIVQWEGPFTLSAFYDYLATLIVPLIGELPESFYDWKYMEYTGVGSVVHFQSVKIEDAFYRSCYGYFSNGFSREEAPDSWRSFLDDAEVFMPCLRDPQKLQIRARSIGEVQKLADTKSIPTLAELAKVGRMSDQEIRVDIIVHAPSLEILFNKWQGQHGAGLDTFHPTTVGMAIGDAYLRGVIGETGSLENLL